MLATMRFSLSPLVAIAPLVLLAACVGPSEPPPPPEPSPAPAPAPAPVPAPPPAPNWADRTATPGDWRYAREGGGSVARFGTQFAMRCVGGNQIALERAGSANASSMTIRTSSATRALPARVQGGNVVALLPARDNLLDAIGFSRGRFAVEVAGTPGLILPTWAEVQRVVEDCRR